MGHVVGQGERSHPPQGNALVITKSPQGDDVATYLWLTQFATDLNLQIDSAQVRAGLIHRPIRFAERYLMFSAIWNVKDRPKYLQFVQTLRDHWSFNLGEERLTPMKLTYYGANKTWLGFIQGADVAYAVTDVILSYQFQMRIMPVEAQEVAITQGSAPFMPTAGDVKHFGPAWYTIRDFVAENIGVGNEGPGGATNPNESPVSPRTGPAPRGNTSGGG